VITVVWIQIILKEHLAKQFKLNFYNIWKNNLFELIGNNWLEIAKFHFHSEPIQNQFFQFSVQFQFFFSFLCFSTFWHLNNLRPVGEKLFYFHQDGFKFEKGEKPEWILFIWDLWLKKLVFGLKSWIEFNFLQKFVLILQFIV
jgi:hypothetical protein